MALAKQFTRLTRPSILLSLLCTIVAIFSVAAVGTEQTGDKGNSTMASSNSVLTSQQLIDHLGLEAHVEGGYFRRTFQADHRPPVATPTGDRFTLTSIYYLLTSESPIGHWHLNKSDIIHYFHTGAPITYYVIDPDGKLSTFTLGPDPTKGHQFQYAVTGGSWKASHLENGEYGLISEAVAPGFDFRDMTLGNYESLVKAFPALEEVIAQFSKK